MKVKCAFALCQPSYCNEYLAILFDNQITISEDVVDDKAEMDKLGKVSNNLIKTTPLIVNSSFRTLSSKSEFLISMVIWLGVTMSSLYILSIGFAIYAVSTALDSPLKVYNAVTIKHMQVPIIYDRAYNKKAKLDEKKSTTTSKKGDVQMKWWW